MYKIYNNINKLGLLFTQETFTRIPTNKQTERNQSKTKDKDSRITRKFGTHLASGYHALMVFSP